MTTGASATGIANIAMDGTVLDTWYPNPQLDDTITESGTRRLGAQEKQAAQLIQQAFAFGLVPTQRLPVFPPVAGQHRIDFDTDKGDVMEDDGLPATRRQGQAQE